MLKLDDTKNKLPPRIILYGVPGVGKSSAGTTLPAPLFIPTEPGLDYIDVAKTQLCKNYKQFVAILESLLVEEHQYRSIVVDTIDGLESLIWENVCRDGGKKNIGDFPHGKGYVLALDKVQEILSLLDELRQRKGLIIMLLCHCLVKQHNAPDTEPYDRYILRLNEKAGSLFKMWADCLLFANYKIIVDPSTRKAYGGEERVIFTEERPSHWGKNRLKLPYELPFEEGKFWTILTNNINKKGKGVEEDV